MSSLELIKQELIRQKQLLESKGVVVNNTTNHPSLLDITNAIDTINFDFSATTATEEDVRLGKTFYAQTHEIKTGTFDLSIVDELKNQLKCIISGQGQIEIQIPEDINYIRSYMFSVYTKYTNTLAFNKHNLTIPENILRIESYAFYACNLTGKLTIPSTCEYIGSRAFSYANMEEAEIFAPISEFIPDYLFAYCSNLKKLTYHEPASYFGPYCCYLCSSLEELYLPSTLKTMSSSCLGKCNALKFVMFNNVNSTSISATLFKDCPTASLLVPYQSYDAFYNATNYQQYETSMYGHGDFKQNDILPTEAEGYTITWHQTLDDAKSGLNPLLICPQDGKMFAVFTETNAT